MKLRLAKQRFKVSVCDSSGESRVAAGVAADLSPLCRAAASRLRFRRAQQVSVAGYILDEVHEGGAGVRTRSDVDHVAGAAEFKSGLRLAATRERKLERIPLSLSTFSCKSSQLQASPIFHLFQVWQLLFSTPVFPYRPLGRSLLSNIKSKKCSSMQPSPTFIINIKMLLKVNLPRARLTERALLLSERNRAASSRMILQTMTYYT